MISASKISKLQNGKSHDQTVKIKCRKCHILNRQPKMLAFCSIHTRLSRDTPSNSPNKKIKNEMSYHLKMEIRFIYSLPSHPKTAPNCFWRSNKVPNLSRRSRQSRHHDQVCSDYKRFSTGERYLQNRTAKFVHCNDKNLTDITHLQSQKPPE